MDTVDPTLNTEWYYGVEDLQVNSNGTCTFRKDDQIESADCLKTPLYGSKLTSFLESEIADDVVGNWSGKTVPQAGGSDAQYYDIDGVEPSGTYSGESDLVVVDPEDDE